MLLRNGRNLAVIITPFFFFFFLLLLRLFLLSFFFFFFFFFVVVFFFFYFFFFLIVPTVPSVLSPRSGLLPFIPILKRFPTIRNSSLHNICSHTHTQPSNSATNSLDALSLFSVRTFQVPSLQYLSFSHGSLRVTHRFQGHNDAFLTVFDGARLSFYRLTPNLEDWSIIFISLPFNHPLLHAWTMLGLFFSPVKIR